MSYKLSIISPEGTVFDDTVDSVAVSGVEGGFEVYSLHAPLLAALKPGRAHIHQKNKTITYEIPSGVLEVTPEHDVLLLADQATLVQPSVIASHS